MNKKLTTAGATLRASSYTSPVAKITEIHSEGLLCMSMIGKLSFEQNEEWIEKDLDW